MRRLVLVVALAALAILLVACAGKGDTRTGSTGTTATPITGTPTTAGGLARQYGVRYCEVLTVTRGATATKAEVWGTQGLNDCPQAAFDAIDLAAVRNEMGVTLAMRNGPRYWVLDDIVAHQIAGSGQIRDFGDIEMRSIATVDFGNGLPDRSPYSRISVKRDTEFTFDTGRTIYELTAPDGTTYVMQSYSLEIDPTLTVEALGALGPRLQLPTGWKFTTRTLNEPLIVEDVGGIATVIQDELHNSYQQESAP